MDWWKVEVKWSEGSRSVHPLLANDAYSIVPIFLNKNYNFLPYFRKVNVLLA